MKHHFFHHGWAAEQMGADMAIQFMLMMLFQLVPEMADDPRGFRADVHKELTDLVATYKLPPMPARYSMASCCDRSNRTR
jgi:hypothetical protein